MHDAFGYVFVYNIIFFFIQATWSVPSACSAICVLWKTFMGKRAGILDTMKRDVQRNVSGELHTTDCYCLQERNLSSVKVHKFHLNKTTSINFFFLFLPWPTNAQLYICIPTNCTQLIHFINNTLKHMHCLKL